MNVRQMAVNWFIKVTVILENFIFANICKFDQISNWALSSLGNRKVNKMCKTSDLHWLSNRYYIGPMRAKLWIIFDIEK